MTISLLNSQFSMTRELSSMRQQMTDLQRQLATGKKADTYGGLGPNRLNVLSLRGRTSALEGYVSTIDLVGVRLAAAQTNLQRFADITAVTRTAAPAAPFELITSDQTQLQVSSTERLSEAISLLNFEVGGRHLFAGRDTQARPVVDIDTMLQGDGLRAGLIQMIAERKSADLGADGRGRLVIPAAAGPVASLAEDAAGSPFGYKLAGAINGLTGTSVTGPAGAPPSIDVTFSATPPNQGDTLRLILDMPDGTSETIIFTAVSGAPASPEEFTIGPDAATTAANFQAAMVSAIEGRAQTQLAAASSVQATNDMFVFDDANPPQRVTGPPFESATALQNATPADTVYWYVGDAGTGSARDSAVAKIDKSLLISYGIRANEEAPRTVIANLAVLAAETFSVTNPNDEARFAALTDRVSSNLSFAGGAQSVVDLVGELGFKQETIGSASARHRATQVISDGLIERYENADSFEVAARLLQLQTQLQASFEATSLISSLSMVNFMR